MIGARGPMSLKSDFRFLDFDEILFFQYVNELPRDFKNGSSKNAWRYQDMIMENYADSDPEKVF